MVITYDYPLNERIRTLLRLEDLFARMLHFVDSPEWMNHHLSLLYLFEVIEVAGRADLKVDLVQELERQRQLLLSYRNNPEISEEALSGALYEIEQSSAALLAMAGKIGQYLRENDWLMAIRSRAAIPGGVCQFDLPGYHYWLNRDSAARQHDLAHWIRPMLPIRDGIAIVLRLLRGSGHAEFKTARAGVFQMSMSGRSAQMLRLVLERSEIAVPEISANKYALNIRFLSPEVVSRARPVEVDIGFHLTFCVL